MPATHSLGDNATLVELVLSKTAEVLQRLRAGGVQVTIANDAGGMHAALLPKFLQLGAAPDSCIAQAVALAVAEDLDGWNVDFELGAAERKFRRPPRCLRAFWISLPPPSTRQARHCQSP